MISIQELLKDRPVALAYVNELAAKHDVWVVGGAARVLLYPFLPFPSDIDLLINTEQAPSLTASAQPATTGSGGQGQKETIGGILFDVFDNGLVRWLNGVPCNGDGLAIRVSDSFVLMTRGFGQRWASVSEHYVNVRPDYLLKHQASLDRDALAVTEACVEDMAAPQVGTD